MYMLNDWLFLSLTPSHNILLQSIHRDLLCICNDRLFLHLTPLTAHRLRCQLLQSLVSERGQHYLHLPFALWGHGEPVRSARPLHFQHPCRGWGRWHTHAGRGRLHSGELHPLPPPHVRHPLAGCDAVQLQQNASVRQSLCSVPLWCV